MTPLERYNELYEELVEVAHKIDPYYDIDKIKPYSVYIWTKNGWENVPIAGNGIPSSRRSLTPLLRKQKPPSVPPWQGWAVKIRLRNSGR